MMRPLPHNPHRELHPQDSEFFCEIPKWDPLRCWGENFRASHPAGDKDLMAAFPSSPPARPGEDNPFLETCFLTQRATPTGSPVGGGAAVLSLQEAPALGTLENSGT